MSLRNRRPAAGRERGINGALVSSQICISLNKDEPDTPLTALMKTKGAHKIREALGSYVGFLKSGER